MVILTNKTNELNGSSVLVDDKFAKKLEEITKCFPNSLVLYQIEPTIAIVKSESFHRFGNELIYRCSGLKDTLSIYVAIMYRFNTRNSPYPVDLSIAADFQTGRIRDLEEVRCQEILKPPFLFAESVRSWAKKRLYDKICELKKGSSIKDLGYLLDSVFPVQ